MLISVEPSFWDKNCEKCVGLTGYLTLFYIRDSKKQNPAVSRISGNVINLFRHYNEEYLRARISICLYVCLIVFLFAYLLFT